MYLVVIAWLYVVLMMSVAEAAGTNGSLLGAIVTFFLYGLIPLSLVVYLMLWPERRRAIRAREAAEAAQPAKPEASVGEPDAGSHAARAAESDSVPPMGEIPR